LRSEKPSGMRALMISRAARERSAPRDVRHTVSAIKGSSETRNVGRHRPAFFGQLADNHLQNLADIREHFLAGIAPRRGALRLSRGGIGAPAVLAGFDDDAEGVGGHAVLLGFMPPLYYIGAVPPP
jgi:hypothetical protein